MFSFDLLRQNAIFAAMSEQSLYWLIASPGLDFSGIMYICKFGEAVIKLIGSFVLLKIII